MIKTKKCSCCKTEKQLTDFHKNKTQKDGYKNQCKICVKIYKNTNRINEYNKNYFIENKETLLTKNKEYYNKNKKEILQNNKRWREENLNKEKEQKRLKLYKLKNSEKISEYQKMWRENNKKHILIYTKKYRIENKNKINDDFIKRYHNNQLFKLSVNIRNTIRNSLKNKNYNKNSKTQEILGCSFNELKQHIESKFESWMSWNNHGLYNGSFNYGWDIDHIKPLATATSEEDIIKLNHYTNLQPLCSKVNRDIKRNN
jgi:hypothetical protein